MHVAVPYLGTWEHGGETFLKTTQLLIFQAAKDKGLLLHIVRAQTPFADSAPMLSLYYHTRCLPHSEEGWEASVEGHSEVLRVGPQLCQDLVVEL